MALTEEFKGFAQKEVIVIPIIDCSGSMSGDKMGQVNEAMSEVPDQLRQINDESLDAKLLIAPIQFSTGARWFALQNNEPGQVELFRWIDMKAGGLTDFGAALDLLNEKLTVTEKGGWMKGRGGAAPVIILLSDGSPTDSYKTKLKNLQKRGWFSAAIKFAVAIGADADKDMLCEFTGNMEAVIDSEQVRTNLASIVRTVIVSASRTASQSASVSGNTVAPQTVTEDGPAADETQQKVAIENVTNELNMNDTDSLFPV